MDLSFGEPTRHLEFISIPAASLPAAGNEGDVYYVQEDDILYFWDSSRSGWLSIETIATHHVSDANMSGVHLLDFQNSPTSATSGMVLPRAAKIVAVSYYGGVNGTTLSVTSSGFFLANLGVVAGNMFVSNTLSVNLNASQRYEVRLSGSASYEKCLLYVKWRR